MYRRAGLLQLVQRWGKKHGLIVRVSCHEQDALTVHVVILSARRGCVAAPEGCLVCES